MSLQAHQMANRNLTALFTTEITGSETFIHLAHQGHPHGRPDAWRASYRDRGCRFPPISTRPIYIFFEGNKPGRPGSLLTRPEGGTVMASITLDKLAHSYLGETQDGRDFALKELDYKWKTAEPMHCWDLRVAARPLCSTSFQAC
jgi:hypothetical protein